MKSNQFKAIFSAAVIFLTLVGMTGGASTSQASAGVEVTNRWNLHLAFCAYVKQTGVSFPDMSQSLEVAFKEVCAPKECADLNAQERWELYLEDYRSMHRNFFNIFRTAGSPAARSTLGNIALDAEFLAHHTYSMDCPN